MPSALTVTLFIGFSFSFAFWLSIFFCRKGMVRLVMCLVAIAAAGGATLMYLASGEDLMTSIGLRLQAAIIGFPAAAGFLLGIIQTGKSQLPPDTEQP